MGIELDLTARYQIDVHLVGLVGYSRFFSGSFIRNSGSARDVDFLYAQLEYTF